MRAGSAIAAVLGLAALGLVGCGGGGAGSSHATSARSTATSRSPQATGNARGAVPRCRPDDLVVAHHGLGGGALSTYGTTFTVLNISEHACSASGFPKLVALGTDGRSIGGPATDGTPRKEGPPGAVTIRPNYDAQFRASWSEDVYADGKCRPRTVVRYRVTLPGTHLAQIVPFPYFGRCTNAATDRSFSVGRLETEPRENDLVGEPTPEGPRPGERLPRCADSELLVWTGPHDAGGVAAGTSYGHVEVANLSDHPCTLSGIPRMVAVDLHGRQVGPPVARSKSMPTSRGRPVTVARIGPHRSAFFTYSVGDALDYGDHGCGFEYAAGFDVTLPGALNPQYVPAPVRRCLHSVRPNGPQVSVGPIE